MKAWEVMGDGTMLPVEVLHFSWAPGMVTVVRSAEGGGGTAAVPIYTLVSHETAQRLTEREIKDTLGKPQRDESLYGTIEEPYCFICMRPTDHAGEH